MNVSSVIDVDYNVELQTGKEQIEPLDSPVYIQIYGNIATTPKLFLEPKEATFAANSIEKFRLSSNDVGEVRTLSLCTISFKLHSI